MSDHDWDGIIEHNRHLGELRAKDAEIERLLAALKAITELGDVRADEASQIAHAAIAKAEGK